MPAAATLDAAPLPMDLELVPVVVLRYRPWLAQPWEPLADVLPISVTRHEGPRPSEAVFRYRIDEETSTIPTDFPQLMPLAPSAPTVLRQDDRLVVAALGAQGEIRFLFDGFVTCPELDLGPERQAVPIQAVGVEVRAWDEPLGGALVRHASRFDVTEGATVLTGLPARFNPDGKPNCTGPGYDSIEIIDAIGFMDTPVFIDPAEEFIGNLLAGPRRPWTLDQAARYILVVGNSLEVFVQNPPLGTLADMLAVRVPLTDDGTYDADNPATFTTYVPEVPDQSVTDRPWPEALYDLINRHGFTFKFGIANVDGHPQTGLVIYPETAQVPAALGMARDLYLQPSGQWLDPGRSGLQRARVQRDASNLIGLWGVRLAPTAYEVGLVLAPGFEIVDADGDGVEARKQWLRSNAGPNTDPRKYRSWVFSETGDGYTNVVWESTGLDNGVQGWEIASRDWRTGRSWVGDLTPVFGDGAFVERLRPGRSPLVTKGPDGEPREWHAAVLLGPKHEDGERVPYSGPVPGVWDGTGDVYPIKGSVRLDPDRLGILITCEDPNAFSIGGHEDIPELRGGVLRLVEWLTVKPRAFWLILFCTIEADATPLALAGVRPSNPSRYPAGRRVDARDRYKLTAVHYSSRFFDPARELTINGAKAGYYTERDDTDAALDDARARREATQTIPFAGPHTIPRLTNLYTVGARIRGIVGRTMSYQTNAGSEAGEGRVYPRIVSLTWTFDPGQTTTIQLSDRRGSRV